MHRTLSRYGWRLRPVAAACGFALQLSAHSSCAHAQASKDWAVSVGAWVNTSPEYGGARDTEIIWRPVIELVWKDRLFLSNQRGVGVWLISKTEAAGLRVGGSLAPSFDDRDTEGTDRLSGLRSVGEGVEARIFAHWRLAEVDFGIVAARELSGEGHGGHRVELSGSRAYDLSPQLSLSLVPYMVWGDRKFAQSLYGVSRTEALNSAFDVYELNGGLERAGGGLELAFTPSRNLEVSVEWDASRLLGAVAGSPIVQARMQQEFSLTTRIQF